MSYTTSIAVSVFCAVLLVCHVQCRPTKDIEPEWKPQYQLLEDFMRCHGAPCEVWDRTAQKIKEIEELEKELLRKQNLVTETKETSDNAEDVPTRSKRSAQEGDEEEEDENSLDLVCELLTEEQLDTMMDGLKDKLNGESQKGDLRSQRQKRQVVEFQVSTHLKWNRNIPYKFDGRHSADEKRMIREAIRRWTEETCVRFDEKHTDAPIAEPHLVFTAGRKDGCRSWVGRTFEEQQINLAPICFMNTMEGRPIHEIGHALGLWHQQQRQDRDDHIRINWDNLDYYSSQFLKAGGTENYDVPYDMGSIMHYAANDGSRNQYPTIEAVNPLYQNTMGQRIEISFNDAKIINRAYCSDVCPYALPFTCRHEGYQDPNHCDKCKCADGWTGDDCGVVAPSINAQCGGVINAGDYPQYITSPGYESGHYDNFQSCNWHIKAAPGHRIVLEFEDEFGMYCKDDEICYHWLEVRYNGNLGTRGPRLCGYKRPEDKIVSSDEEMLLVFRSSWEHDLYYARKGFKATIRTEPNPYASHREERSSETTLPTTRLPTTWKKPTTIPTQKPTTPRSHMLVPEIVGTNHRWSCDFDGSNGASDWCGMEQDTFDDFDWTIQSGKTPSDETGPESAHDGNYYIYIEASNPRKAGDKATIWMPFLEKRGQVCLTFYYHMFGFHVNLLETAVKRASGRTEYPFQMEGQQGNDWRAAAFDFYMDYGDRIGFSAFRGEAFSGDIALDSIVLRNGHCQM